MILCSQTKRPAACRGPMYTVLGYAISPFSYFLALLTAVQWYRDVRCPRLTWRQTPCSIHVCSDQMVGCTVCVVTDLEFAVQGLALPRHLTEPQDTPRVSTNGRNKRVTTAHACAECKRRKIKCDGKQPCGPCAGCRVPKPCYYDKHRERVIPSRK